MLPAVMLTLDLAEQWAWWLSTAGYAVLLIHLRREGLDRIYKFFWAYVLYEFVSATALAFAAPVASSFTGNSSPAFAANVYGWLWLGMEPLFWVLYILVVLELYGLVLQKYRGIATLGRWTISAGLVIALVIASLTLSADFGNPAEKFPLIRWALVIHREVVSSLVVFLLLITAFLAWYPVPLNRNVVVHSIAYAVYFLSLTAVFLVRNIAGSQVTQVVNVAASIVSLVCLGVWILFLNRRGEASTVTLRQYWRPQHADRLVEQLASINSTLLRSARR